MGKFNNIILCLVGKSGCGKSTMADKLHNMYGYEVLQSYTTRPRRSEDESGHVFVTEEEYEAIPEKVATTCFDGFNYCATKEQVNNNDIYIIDPKGLKELKDLYTKFGGTKRIISVYLNVPMETCLERMLQRGDKKEDAWKRIEHDYDAFMGVLGDVDYNINGISNSAWVEVKHIIAKEEFGGK